MESKYSKHEPCYLCRHLGLSDDCPADFHHIQEGKIGKRGEKGIYLCPSHHRIGKDSIHVMGKKAWRRRFNVTEQELLAKYG
jgi:hypothetical protein